MNEAKQGSVREWHVEVEEEVEWGDVDRYQHVNNVALFRKFQEVRVLLTRRFCDALPANTIVVTARVQMDYVKEVRYGCRITYRGAFTKFTKSTISVGFEAESNGHIAVRGEAVMCVVGEGGKSIPLSSPSLLEAMATLQERMRTKERYVNTLTVSPLSTQSIPTPSAKL
jgi:acyl-CoA thioester hydrolase